MKIRKIAVLFCSAMLLTQFIPFFVSAKEAEMRDITTLELVHDMGLGINLGNTYESCGDWIAQWGDGTPESYITAWGSPVITQEMIHGYAEEGFSVLRVPVAWSNMMGEDYTISEAYLGSVRETVDWALDCGLYVILNIHYDNGWFSGFSTNREECMKKYICVWEQLTNAFANYDDHLIFESLNEEGCWEDIWNRWSGESDSKKQAYSLLNDINQTFVDIVRNSVGNNPERHLLIAGYATDIDLTCDNLFEMPDDPENRCAVSVHYYTPSYFAILEEDTDWGKARSTWGTDADFEQLNHYMDMMKATFIDNGIPVIVGEYGCPKNNKDEESVRLFLTSVCKAAYERQLCPILWDITGLHYNRDTCQMYDSQLKKSLQEIVNRDTSSISGDVNSDGEFSILDVVLFKKWLLAIPVSSKLLRAHEPADDI
ncbi:MAG: cellulase family glycosylhydrolase, partial [Lachnospiraceae bacterium]|nr:cellulase family glycosylhydrolase [Lachnospiraceae bacterium]